MLLLLLVGNGDNELVGPFVSAQKRFIRGHVILPLVVGPFGEANKDFEKVLITLAWLLVVSLICQDGKIAWSLAICRAILRSQQMRLKFDKRLNFSPLPSPILPLRSRHDAAFTHPSSPSHYIMRMRVNRSSLRAVLSLSGFSFTPPSLGFGFASYQRDIEVEHFFLGWIFLDDSWQWKFRRKNWYEDACW